MGLGRKLALVVGALLALGAPPAAATPLIWAHRGGAYVDGVPRYAENTLPAFRHAARQGYTLELDVKLTQDRVPVVIHDDTVDRTTACTGAVSSFTAADLRARCPVDVLGVPGSGLPTSQVAQPHTRIPTLARVLRLVKRHHATVAPEIKNLPTDNDFDAGIAYANTVMDAIKASGLPPDRVIVQSFWPTNLEVAAQRMPGVGTSLLTLGPLNDLGGPVSALRNYDWVSGQAPLDRAGVILAHSLGAQVVPYTVDTPGAVRAEAARGADAIITNDPPMARATLAAAYPPPPIPPPPSPEACAAARAHRELPTITAFDDHAREGGIRVFAMQFKQELRHVRSQATFRTKIECMIRDHVVPHLAAGRPNVVVFPEDVGLMALAGGPQGAVARGLFDHPHQALSCEPQGIPCATLAALGAVSAGYAKELALYRLRFPLLPPLAATFVAATDTLASGWMQTFSDMARRYGIYIAGSADQAPFRETTDPLERATLGRYVATAPEVYNEAFLWGPHDVRSEGPAPLRNVVASNRKVPLTSIEQLLELTPGPSTGPAAIENLRPYRIPGSQARVGFATSLPAFQFGPAGAPPCADVSKTYMRCLDALGANVVLQDEANPGRWANTGAVWQPEDWLGSTYRSVADPTVGFLYNVTPMMVGNLADLAFDGQSAITQRGGTAGPGCDYIGNPERKHDFLALAPWVVPGGSRDELRAVGAKLAPGSGDALENDYAETAIAADLTFPPDAAREGCAGR